ncbi:MAG TPA: hypothetical protein VHZ07_06235 [Bryobacteraceae bacterium]|nr:hypothetical protein [Bryobacteraceae bacterium]
MTLTPLNRKARRAAKLYVAAKHDRKSFDPADYGFEFSTADLEGGK